MKYSFLKNKFRIRGIILLLILCNSCTILKDDISKGSEKMLDVIPNVRKVELYSDFDQTLNYFDYKYNFQLIKNQNSFFDFENGERINSQNADILLFVSCGSSCFNNLITINDTTSTYFGKTEPGYENCLLALQKKDTNQIIHDLSGDYSCFKTKEGSIIQVLIIENLPRMNNSKVKFESIIWPNNFGSG